MSVRKVLDVGCGDSKGVKDMWPGAEIVRVDADPDVKPDIVADACSLPFSDGEYDVVLASHVLEHLRKPKVMVALKEWARVGKDVWVIVPDLIWALERIAERDVDAAAMSVLWGEGGENDYNLHRVGFTMSLLRSTLEMLGMHVLRAEMTPFKIVISDPNSGKREEVWARQILVVYSRPTEHAEPVGLPLVLGEFAEAG